MQLENEQLYRDVEVAIVYWRRRRKVYGNLLDKQGNPIANAKVYLEGKDVLETVTDENGYFEFKSWFYHRIKM